MEGPAWSNDFNLAVYVCNHSSNAISTQIVHCWSLLDPSCILVQDCGSSKIRDDPQLIQCFKSSNRSLICVRGGIFEYWNVKYCWKIKSAKVWENHLYPENVCFQGQVSSKLHNSSNNSYYARFFCFHLLLYVVYSKYNDIKKNISIFWEQ